MLTELERRKKQATRLYERAYGRIVVRDMFGADWRTLRITNPQGYIALRLAYNTMRTLSPNWWSNSPRSISLRTTAT